MEANHLELLAIDDTPDNLTTLGAVNELCRRLGEPRDPSQADEGGRP